MAQYADGASSGRPRVLDLSNVESGLMRRFARHQRNPLTRLYARLTARKLVRYEARVASTFSRILTCSSDDRDLLVVGRGPSRHHGHPQRRRHRILRPARRPEHAARSWSSSAGWTMRPTPTVSCSFIDPSSRSSAPSTLMSRFTVVGQHPAACHPGARRHARSHGHRLRGRRQAVRGRRFRGGRAAPLRQRYAPQDPRGHGHGKGSGLHDRRLRGPSAGARTPRSSWPTIPRLFADAVCRLLGRPGAPRQIGRLVSLGGSHGGLLLGADRESLLSVYDTSRATPARIHPMPMAATSPEGSPTEPLSIRRPSVDGPDAHPPVPHRRPLLLGQPAPGPTLKYELLSKHFDGFIVSFVSRNEWRRATIGRLRAVSVARFPPGLYGIFLVRLLVRIVFTLGTCLRLHYWQQAPRRDHRLRSLHDGLPRIRPRAIITGAKLVVEVNNDFADSDNWDPDMPVLVRRLKALWVRRVGTFMMRRADSVKLLYPTQVDTFYRGLRTPEQHRVFPRLRGHESVRAQATRRPSLRPVRRPSLASKGVDILLEGVQCDLRRVPGRTRCS